MSTPQARPKTITRKVEVTVEFHQVDMMQVVHNTHYLYWFERGRLQVLEDIFPMSWAIENRIVTPVVEHHIEYLCPATYGDRLVVTTRHRKLNLWEGRLVFEHSISNTKTKAELCRGQSAVTAMHLESKALLKEIPDHIWQRYLALK